MGKQSWKAGNMLNPVPAVMVSVADQNHRPNIITVAWAGTVCTNPPMVSISVRPSRYSYEIIEKTGEFVINLTNEKPPRNLRRGSISEANHRINRGNTPLNNPQRGKTTNQSKIHPAHSPSAKQNLEPIEDVPH